MNDPVEELRARAYSDEILMELREATGRFGPFASPHEGMAVIREEYLEMERAVFHGTALEAKNEAIQLAAMALRYMVDCDHMFTQCKSKRLEAGE